MQVMVQIKTPMSSLKFVNHSPLNEILFGDFLVKY